MSEIVPLFSKPIYKSVLDQTIIKSVLDQAKKTDFTGDLISITTQDYLIDRLPVFKGKIVNKINDYLYNYLKINNSFSYYFPDSWFVRIQPQSFAKKHIHCNSLFSGIVYLQTVSNGGSIKFSKDQCSSHFNVKYKIPYDELNLYNCDDFLIEPEPGLILIFPSSMFHSVTINSSNEDRYSFAFNILPDNFRDNYSGRKILDR